MEILKKMNGFKPTSIASIFLLIFPVCGNAELAGLKASLGVTDEYDDNIFRQESAEEKDHIYTVTPGLGIEKQFSKHKLSANYVGVFSSYANHSNEDFDEHTLDAGLLLDLTTKLNVDLQAGRKLGHEARGSSGVIPGVSAEPNTTEEERLFSSVTYGRRNAKAKIQLDLDSKDFRFTNNSQEYRDRDVDSVSGRLYYNIASKTSLIFELSEKTINYLNSVSRNRDSTETYAHVGLSWEATYKTTGDIKVGRFKKDFDSASENDGDGASAIASIVWAPRTYSQFTFSATRQANETTTTDSFYVSHMMAATWEHKFNSRFSFNADLSDGKDDYSGTRLDKSKNYGLGIKYQVGMFDLGVAYKYSERKSNTADASFEDNIYMLSISI